jgi:hypothetical protein
VRGVASHDVPEAPYATYAEQLDGDTLTLDVVVGDAHTDFALRSPSTGEVLALELVPTGGAGPGSLGGYVDLLPHAAAIAAERSGHELVVIDRGSEPIPVAWAGRRLKSPVQPPVSSDGHWRFSLACQAGVVVGVETVRDLPRVQRIALDTGSLAVDFTSPVPPLAVLLVTEDGSPVDELPIHREGDLFQVRVDAGGLALGDEAVAALFGVEVDGGVLPLHRCHTDLRNPGPSVILPKLTEDPARGSATLTVLFRRDGQLAVRREMTPEGPVRL